MMFRTGFFALVSGLLLFALVPAAAQSPTMLPEPQLISALRAGGYNLYFRHVTTDWSQADSLQAAGDWLSCDPAQMRQLSERGRRDARNVGEAMRRLQIPVGEVLASPYCRTMETARLLGQGEVKASTQVMNLLAAEYFGGRAAIVSNARQLLSSPPATANRVIVAHGNVARDATPVYPSEGEAIVILPLNNGEFRVVGRLTPADWRRLAEALGE